MILQCEACGTKFEAPDAAFTDGGRTVRCAVCKHSWFFDPAAKTAPPPEEKPETLAAEHIEPAPIPEETPEEKAQAQPEKPLAPPSPKRYAAARAAQRKRLYAGPPRWLSALSAALFLIVLGLALLNFAPSMAGLKPTTDFALTGLTMHQAPKGGYLVSGTIVNKGSKPQGAPKLRLALLDDKGRVVKTWQRDLPGAVVEAGERLAFTVDGLDAPSEKIVDPHIRVELGNALELALRKVQ